MAGGQVLQPGTYEVRLTGEHVKPLPGQSEEAEQRVEFVSGGRVVARDVAEVMPGAGEVGRHERRHRDASARVERLKADEFLRVSMNREGERYLIYLPLATVTRAVVGSRSASTASGYQLRLHDLPPSCRNTARTRADAAAVESDRAPSFASTRSRSGSRLL